MQHSKASTATIEQRLDPIEHGDHHAPTRAAALRSLGSVVYFLRMPGGAIKIGFTRNLAARANQLAGSEVLAWMPGTPAIERSIHSRLACHRAYAHEYYKPVPAIMDEVNYARRHLGLDPI